MTEEEKKKLDFICVRSPKGGELDVEEWKRSWAAHGVEVDVKKALGVQGVKKARRAEEKRK